MLLRMLPDQIKDHWDEIKPAIQEALPIYAGKQKFLINDLLVSILTERLTVWISYKMLDGAYEVNAVITTAFSQTDFDTTRNLVIFTLYGYNFLTAETWIEATEAFTKYAKVNGCSNIIAYTDNEMILKQVKKLGVKTTTLVVLPVEGE